MDIGRSDTDTETKEERKQRNSERRMLFSFWATLGAGVVSLLIFATSAGATGKAKVFALGVLVGGAAALLGALLGFLFGLPRSGSAEAGAAAVEPAQKPGSAPETDSAKTAPAARDEGKRFGYVNNNLLEISDWLTKIIVGAGLVGLKDLVRWLGGVGQAIGEGAALDGALARVFGCSVITFFFAWGFLFVYIQTRTIISFIFASMERSLETLRGRIRDAVATAVREDVLPQIKEVSENTILQLLYSNRPGAADAVAGQARSFLERSGNEKNGRVWLYLACAYGQQHERVQDANVKIELADKAYNALKRALEADPNLRGIARGLLYQEDPQHLPGDDDLATLRDDRRFQELVGPPPRK